MLTTFHVKVRIEGKEKDDVFITGAKTLTEAVENVNIFLKANSIKGIIGRVMPKDAIYFVPPLTEGDSIPF